MLKTKDVIMTRKRRRLYFIALVMFGLFAGTALVLSAFQDNLVFFFSPTEIAAKKPGPHQRVRMGGRTSVLRGGYVVPHAPECTAVRPTDAPVP